MLENNFIQITSLNNEIVKDCAKLHQKKYRKEAGLLVLEGEKSVFGALEDNVKIKSVFVCEEELACKVAQKDKDIKIYMINDKIMGKISQTVSPTNILALALEPKYNFDDFLKMKKIALLDNIKDAGNLGTIIRSAIAFGIEGILLYGECVDEFSSKVIRSSAGNIFKIPIIHLGSDTRAIEKLKKTHKIIMTVVDKNAKDPCELDLKENICVMFGSEANGLCNELLTLGDVPVTLKMDKNVESLNLSVFAGIMFFILNRSN